MATEYKFHGSTDPSTPTESLYLSGSVANPPADEDIIAKGDVVSLSDDEVKAYREQGLKFTKTSESASDNEDSDGDDKPSTKAEQSAQQESVAPKAGALSSTSTPAQASAAGTTKK